MHAAATRWQQSCSHSNAICKRQSCKNTHRTTHTGTTTRKLQNTEDRNSIELESRSKTAFCRTHEVPFIERLNCNILHGNIQLRFTAWRPASSACIYAHGSTRWQHSCSHSNAIYHHSVKKRIELRTQEQPLVAKPIGGTDWTRNDPNRNRRTHEVRVPFIAGCSHFTRKNTRFRAPASSPQHSPCNIHAAIPMRSATTASRNA